MLLEILTESILDMDEETLNTVIETCNTDDLELMCAAMERYTVMSTLDSKDQEDFDFIRKTQRKASKDGWKAVNKQDRDKFVATMTYTDKLPLLYQAIQLGKREASYNARAKAAMKTSSIITPNDVIGEALPRASSKTAVTIAPHTFLGGGIGTVASTAVVTGSKLAGRAKRHLDDASILKHEGDIGHPGDRWKSNRQRILLHKLKEKIMDAMTVSGDGIPYDYSELYQRS